MAQNIANEEGIVSDANYPSGYKIDNESTVVGEIINQDMIQFFQKMMKIAALTPNNRDDNEVNGYQFLSALYATLRKNCLPDSGITVGLSRAASFNETMSGSSDILFISPAMLKSMRLIKKTVAIGSWNMNTTENREVPHGLSATEYKTISNISVMILDNSGTNSYPLFSFEFIDELRGNIDYVSPTNINILRNALSRFGTDGTFNNTTLSFVTFEYAPD